MNTVKVFFRTILRLIIRFLRQQTYKNFRTIKSKQRLLGTIWVEANKIRINDLINSIGRDQILFEESQNFEKRFKLIKKDLIKNLPISGGLKGSSGGGGDNIFILYYIVRFFKPEVVLESGVSAGTSSGTIVHALDKNNKGILYSSDLPMLLDEKDIGILVPNELKYRWKLFTKGDSINLPLILNNIKKIDLVYYDSDKSYLAKEFFIEKILKNFDPKVIIIDDIDRDYWFRDFIKKRKNKYNYYVASNVGFLLNKFN